MTLVHTRIEYRDHGAGAVQAESRESARPGLVRLH